MQPDPPSLCHSGPASPENPSVARNTPPTNSVKLVASGSVLLSRAPIYRFGVRFTLLSCLLCTRAALAAQAGSGSTGSALRRHAPCPRRPAYCCSRGRFCGLCPCPAHTRCSRAVLRLKVCATHCGAALLRASFLQLTARYDALSGWQCDLQRALRAAGVCARWRCAHCFPFLFASSHSSWRRLLLARRRVRP